MFFFTSPRFFRHPEPERRAESIYPVFLPFSGCATRCVFCAQPLQTGRPALASDPAPDGVECILAEAARALEARREKGLPPPEAAFYGGTFTAQPEPVLARCLQALGDWLDRGLVRAGRCSTRPDALQGGMAERLSGAGISLVELGVQSFCDAALERSQRGYGRETALLACERVRRAGLSLGVQLMPGMPGLDREGSLADAALAASLRPDLVRLYPCLVLEGTPLAGWWRQGRFRPWQLEETADFLAEACLLFWRAGVPVARMGLAEEPGLAAGVLAGPRHPALGSMARSRALYRIVAAEIVALGHPGPLAPPGADAPPDAPADPLASADANADPLASAAALGHTEADAPAPRRLEVPRRYQGEFFGLRNELRPAYARLGLEPGSVAFTDREDFCLQ